MSKYDYAIGLCLGEIEALHKAIYGVYEREAGNLGQFMKITKEDCKGRVQRFNKQIAELRSAISVLRKEGEK